MSKTLKKFVELLNKHGIKGYYNQQGTVYTFKHMGDLLTVEETNHAYIDQDTNAENLVYGVWLKRGHDDVTFLNTYKGWVRL